ncbi:MAG: nitronate monooxygenase [Neisseria sp.]|nr:nitronate monooxygenase [Neisseria sp.]
MKSFLPSRFPLIQAPLAGAQDAAMTIAVCRAGGLGSLAAAMLSTDVLAEQIETIQAAVDAPFNLNFFAHTLPDVGAAEDQAWRELLQPFFDEFGIDAGSLPAGVLRRPFDESQLAVVEKYRPAVVSFHFGLPEKSLLDAVKASGAMVLSSATTLAEGLWLQENGADAVIAQGSEAGGHRGMFLAHQPAAQLGTFALLPQLVKALNIPVIAAGGIADTAGIQAALQLGAAAVQLGTAYLLCDESTIGALHRAAIEKVARHPEQCDTALTNVFSGKPARGLINRLMREVGLIHPQVMPFPFAATASGALRRAAEAQGSTDFTPLWCGQNPSGCKAVSAYDLTRELTAAFSRQD